MPSVQQQQWQTLLSTKQSKEPCIDELNSCDCFYWGSLKRILFRRAKTKKRKLKSLIQLIFFCLTFDRTGTTVWCPVMWCVFEWSITNQRTSCKKVIISFQFLVYFVFSKIVPHSAHLAILMVEIKAQGAWHVFCWRLKRHHSNQYAFKVLYVASWWVV